MSAKRKQKIYQLEENATKKQKLNDNENDPIAIRFNQNIKTLYLGPMNIICEFCGAKFFSNEIKNYCRNNLLTDTLKKYIDNLEDIPTLMKNLFDFKDERSKFFFKNIRNLNTAFSFNQKGSINADNSKGGCTFICTGSKLRNKIFL